MAIVSRMTRCCRLPKFFSMNRLRCSILALVISAKSEGSRMTWGVINITKLFLRFPFVVLRNKRPSKGISPKIGTLSRCTVSLSCIRPPKTTVWPSMAITVVWTSRFVDGAAPVRSSGGPVKLDSLWSISKRTASPSLICGVISSVKPVSNGVGSTVRVPAVATVVCLFA